MLAAAVAGVQTDDDNSSSDEERERDSLTLDKAMELWTKHKKRNGEALCFKMLSLILWSVWSLLRHNVTRNKNSKGFSKVG